MLAEWTKEDLEIPASQSSVEGEAPSGFAGGGGDASPFKTYLSDLGDQRDLHINKLIEIDRSILLLAVDGYNISDPEIRKEVETMKALLQDIIYLDQGLMKDLKTAMNGISEKLKEISDAKRLTSGYLSLNYPAAGFLDCSI